MILKTVEQIEEKLTKLIKSVINHNELIHFLEKCENWRERWGILERYVINHLSDHGIERIDWGLNTVQIGFLRDRFFYEMQQQTKMDFGFCKYFIPAYRERTKYFLEGQKEDPKNNWDRCKVNGEEIRTTCCGTNIDHCVFLQDS